MKLYINMNTELKQIQKMILNKLMINVVFGKTIESARKHRDIKLVATEKRRNYLVSKPNFHTTKFFQKI